ncbi:hypothetical protein BGZ65_012944 [Modicella reniformis]|uniref:Uncharacterized protein n=1 Tax=Modicella reniformis TaxID=1440133 RepID=A0A9P6SR19_9FUNG|nr:hypothetical protein BGZ65_012944 [Modicella reniformis]
MAFEGIWNVVMPMGRSRELVRFSKTDLLSSLQIPSERHLLVAGLETKNDYFEGIPWIVIQHNLDVIRNITISTGPRTESVTKAVDLYLEQIKVRGNKTLSDY